jgi:2-phospho-L-lactate transferase/gluconeogenesis factor (CofD/UPF0052 family)
MTATADGGWPGRLRTIGALAALAIAAADLVVIAPSNPVASVAPLPAVPGTRAALRAPLLWSR